MGFLRGPGSLRFKWGMTKALFPELTKTYYKNTGKSSTGRRRQPRQSRSAVGMVSTWYEFAPPSAKEQDWINHFSVFCNKVDVLLSRNTPDARRELYLLCWAGGGIFERNKSFFEGEGRSKAFLDAFIRFGKKIVELGDYIRDIGLEERQAILDSSTNCGQFKLDPNTWAITRPDSASSGARLTQQHPREWLASIRARARRHLAELWRRL